MLFIGKLISKKIILLFLYRVICNTSYYSRDLKQCPWHKAGFCCCWPCSPKIRERFRMSWIRFLAQMTSHWISYRNVSTWTWLPRKLSGCMACQLLFDNSQIMFPQVRRPTLSSNNNIIILLTIFLLGNLSQLIS